MTPVPDHNGSHGSLLTYASAVFIPFAVFLICQIRVRSFWDVNNATIGLLYSLITAAVFQVFIKWLIGGLRPHFLAVCKPVIPANMLPHGNVANGYHQIMFDRSICTGDKSEINDALGPYHGSVRRIRVPLLLLEREVEGLLQLPPCHVEARCHLRSYPRCMPHWWGLDH